MSYSLKKNRGVPQKISDYLEAVLFLSGTRNRDLLNGLAQPLQALNAAGIEPILLKGIASIASALYPDPAMRILSYIDLLVPEREAEKSAQVLASLGFEPFSVNTLIDYSEHHHRVAQRHPDTGVVIELHVRPVLRKWDKLLETQSMTKAAARVRFEGFSVFMPSPTHRVIHNIVHNQLSDANYVSDRLDVRQMLELAALARRHAADIDLPGVRKIFESTGQAAVLHDTLEVVEGLFGVSLGLAIPKSPREPLGHLQREIEKSDLSWLLKQYLSAIRKNPATALAGLRPASWGKILKALRQNLRAQRW